MKTYYFLFAALFSIAACRKQPQIPPAVVNEPENITSVKITFTDSAGIEPATVVSWSDADGAGGNNPIIDSIQLTSNKTYFAEVLIQDETKNPIVNVSAEILKEGTDHQFFFTTTGVNVSIKPNDSDSKGNPIGLKSIWRTKNISSGSLRLILKHQPGVKVNSPGDINAGSTDIDITYSSIIQ